MKLSRQAGLVLDYLRTNLHLTPWQAEGVFHIRRLASRIDELRAAGYEVEKETREDAKGQRYTRYSLSRRQRRAKRPLLPPRVAQTQFRLETIANGYRNYCIEVLDLTLAEATGETETFVQYLKENA